jgi:hypothetical protein
MAKHVNLIPEFLRTILGAEALTPGVQVELTPLEINALYRVLLNTWALGAKQADDTMGKSMLPYVEARLEYVRGFMTDDDVGMIEEQTCPEAGLLHK